LSDVCEVVVNGPAVRLDGAVDFENFATVRADVEQVIEDEATVSVDLSGLNEANSLKVALLLAWFRAANRREGEVVFVDAPRDLRNIIDFSGLTELLPIGSGGVRAEPTDLAED
jgi:anti-anti-sigma factor